jgi:hypothetical protein
VTEDGLALAGAFRVVDDELQVGGVPLTTLAARVGRTPFYVYERAALEARVRLLRQHLPREIVLHYAMKANPMPAVVDFMARLVDGLDVASGGELGVALDSGMDPAQISFAGPGKSEKAGRSKERRTLLSRRWTSVSSSIAVGHVTSRGGSRRAKIRRCGAAVAAPGVLR